MLSCSLVLPQGLIKLIGNVASLKYQRKILTES